MSNQKDERESIISSLILVQAQFQNLNEKAELLFSLLCKTEPPRDEYYIDRDVYDQEIYVQALKLAKLFCKKYGKLTPKKEV